MTAYALAHLRTPTINEEVLVYMDRVQDTLDGYGGRFLVHGGDVEVMEGSWPGSVAIIEFPDVAAARSWYGSAPYQAILRYRTDHVEADAIIVESVGTDYDPRATVSRLRDAM